MMAITDRMKVPTHATIDLSGKGSSDQSYFRAKLIQVYNGPEDVGKDSLWCPLIKHYIINAKTHVKAAHLVPFAIGETNAAYLSAA